jgi:hypothetical protein
MTVRMAARYGHFALEGLRLTGSAGPRFGAKFRRDPRYFPQVWVSVRAEGPIKPKKREKIRMTPLPKGV